MKNLHLYISAGIAAVFMMTGCQSPDYVSPTADRSGITSLQAYFTSGPNINKEAVKYSVDASANVTDYVIPVPWYYPEESDNTTEQYMSSMKVVATMENNCTIDPAITVLDLTKKNAFTYTDPYGTQKQITISGQMTKSNKCAIKTFTLNPGEVSGIVDESKKTISIITAGDLTQCTAAVTLSAHAKISPDPAEAHDYTNGFKYTVTADNGTSTATYTVVQQAPAKVASGIRKNSQAALFDNYLSDYGITSLTSPSLACVENYLVIDAGDGTTPIYMSKVSGKKIGTINLGNADASGCVASDLNGNMLICNYANSGSDLKIYKTKSATAAPTLYTTYSNGLGLALGSHIQIQGSLDGDAVIIATCDGPYAQHFLRWKVTGGKLGNPELVKIEGINQWNGRGGNAKVVNRDLDINNGYFFGYYDNGSPYLRYADNTNTVKYSLKSANTDFGDDYGPNYACNSIDAREFNKMYYLALLNVDYFAWPGTKLYLYDVSSMNSFTGTTEANKVTVYSTNISSTAPAGSGLGDALLIPSKDGYKLDLYYISGNDMKIGGVEFDCIDK